MQTHIHTLIILLFLSTLGWAEPLVKPTPVTQKHHASHVPGSLSVKGYWLGGSPKVELLAEDTAGSVHQVRMGYQIQSDNWYASITNQQSSANQKLGLFSNEDGVSPTSVTALEAGLQLSDDTQLVLCSEAGQARLSANLRFSW